MQIHALEVLVGKRLHWPSLAAAVVPADTAAFADSYVGYRSEPATASAFLKYLSRTFLI